MPELQRPIPRSTRWRPEIRALAGASAYASVAVAARTWDPLTIETDIEGDDSESNKFKKILAGSVPTTHTIKKIVSKHPQCDVERWSRLPLWDVLNAKGLDAAVTNWALNAVSGPSRFTIWIEFDLETQTSGFTSGGKVGSGVLRGEVERADIDELAQHKDLDAFLALTTLHLEARAAARLRVMYWSALRLREMFPAIVGSTPQLAICWPRLADLYRRLVWNPGATVNHPWPESHWDELEAAMLEAIAKALHAGAFMPPTRMIR